MEMTLIILILVTGLYMAWNIGANDVANAMGTSVGSGALTLKQAVIIAAVLEFCGAFFFGSHVSRTIQSGIVNLEFFTSNPRLLVLGMLAALASSGLWLQLASYYGWPVSTTHSIVGALVGFGIVAGGMEAVHWAEVGYIVTSWVFSPLLGAIIAYYLFTIIRKQIFYSSDPLAAAKKWTPLLVFFVVTTLALVLVFEGFRNMNFELTFFEGLLIAIALGTIGAGIGYVCVKRIPLSAKHERLAPIYGPEVVTALEKARKHLQKVRAVASGDVQYNVSSLVDELDLLTNSVQQRQLIENEHSEYQSVEKIFSYLQIMSACMMAFAHGANDVANAIGPLSAALAVLTSGIAMAEAPVPSWLLALGGFGIVVGLATWGWRVMETIGKKITELTPSRGFAAEFGAAATIVLASRLGMPISTTHTLVGAVVGVGLARGLGSINLNTTRDILVSWLITVPIGALIAILVYFPLEAIFG